MVGLGFKPSPFYKMEQQLGDTLPCEGEGNLTGCAGLLITVS